MELLIMKCVFGSHLYGLETPESDKDFKGIYLPDWRSILLGNYRKHYSENTKKGSQSKNSKDDVDCEYYSLPYFIQLACEGDTTALDMLHAENLIEDPTGVWDYLVKNRKLFYTKDMKSYVGYARRQVHKYGVKGSRLQSLECVKATVENLIANYGTEQMRIKSVVSQLPVDENVNWSQEKDRWAQEELCLFYVLLGKKISAHLTLGALLKYVNSAIAKYGERAKQARNNEGIDWKAVSHALRAAYQMQDIFLKGDFQYPLPQTEFLRNVKAGKLDFVSEVQPQLEDVMKGLEYLASISHLPEQVDRGFWDDFLVRTYITHCRA